MYVQSCGKLYIFIYWGAAVAAFMGVVYQAMCVLTYIKILLLAHHSGLPGQPFGLAGPAMILKEM